MRAYLRSHMSQYKRATPALNINNPYTKILTMKIISCYLCNMAYCNMYLHFAEKCFISTALSNKIHIINVYTLLENGLLQHIYVYLYYAKCYVYFVVNNFGSENSYTSFHLYINNMQCNILVVYKFTLI